MSYNNYRKFTHTHFQLTDLVQAIQELDVETFMSIEKVVYFFIISVIEKWKIQENLFIMDVFIEI